MSWWALTMLAIPGLVVVGLALTLAAVLIGRTIATPDDDELDDEGRWQR